jgi:cell division septation protein DedD
MPGEAAVPQKSPPEQIALLNKSGEAATEKPIVRSPLKPLEGFIIQLSFVDKAEAQRWAEKLNARGFAVSATESGSGAFRVRVGNFAARTDAEKQLKALNQDGLKGIVLNLPQVYRPEVHSSAGEANRVGATLP